MSFSDVMTSGKFLNSFALENEDKETNLPPTALGLTGDKASKPPPGIWYWFPPEKAKKVSKPQGSPLLGSTWDTLDADTARAPLRALDLSTPPGLGTDVHHVACLTWPSENSSRQTAHTGAELQLLPESGHSARAFLQLARYLRVASWLIAQAVRC